MIVVLSYRDQPKGATVRSLFSLSGELHAKNIPHGLSLFSQTDIALARNIAATSFLLNKPVTHLLFIDDDMEFKPSAIFRMLTADKPVIGCICPQRKINLDEALNLARAGHDNKFAIAKATGFVNEPPKPSGPIGPVEQIGMGVTMIRRDVLERMRDSNRLNRYNFRNFAVDGPAGPLYGFFDRFPGVGEDHSFCKRWRDECGGEVFAIFDEEVGHIANFSFRTKYSDLLDDHVGNNKP